MPVKTGTPFKGGIGILPATGNPVTVAGQQAAEFIIDSRQLTVVNVNYCGTVILLFSELFRASLIVRNMNSRASSDLRELQDTVGCFSTEISS